MRCTKCFFQTEVVKNQYLQLLCYVIFFDILHHYGVIAASQICSVSRKYCAVLRNRFFFFQYVNVTFFFSHHIIQYLSFLNTLDYYSDNTSIKYKHLEKKGAPTEHSCLNSSLVARAISKKYFF